MAALSLWYVSPKKVPSPFLPERWSPVAGDAEVEGGGGENEEEEDNGHGKADQDHKQRSLTEHLKFLQSAELLCKYVFNLSCDQ